MIQPAEDGTLPGWAGTRREFLEDRRRDGNILKMRLGG